MPGIKKKKKREKEHFEVLEDSEDSTGIATHLFYFFIFICIVPKTWERWSHRNISIQMEQNPKWREVMETSGEQHPLSLGIVQPTNKITITYLISQTQFTGVAEDEW